MKVIRAVILPAGPRDTEIIDMKRGYARGKPREIRRTRNSISIGSTQKK